MMSVNDVPYNDVQLGAATMDDVITTHNSANTKCAFFHKTLNCVSSLKLNQTYCFRRELGNRNITERYHGICPLLYL